MGPNCGTSGARQKSPTRWYFFNYRQYTVALFSISAVTLPQLCPCPRQGPCRQGKQGPGARARRKEPIISFLDVLYKLLEKEKREVNSSSTYTRLTNYNSKGILFTTYTRPFSLYSCRVQPPPPWLTFPKTSFTVVKLLLLNSITRSPRSLPYLTCTNIMFVQRANSALYKASRERGKRQEFQFQIY